MVVRHGEAFTHLRPADGLGRRQGHLSAHGALRLLPVRRGHRLAERAARLRLRAAAEAPHHERRNHQRRRHPRRAAHGPRLQLVVDRQRPEHRGVAPAGAASERHDHAGGHLRGRRRDVDDREPEPGRLRARRPAARLCARTQQAVPGQVHLVASDWTPLQALRQRLRRLQPAAARHDRSVAVQELPGTEGDWQD